MSEWISVDDRLPDIGEWVNVFQDLSVYTEGDILPSGEPNYWYSSDYYYAKVFNRWIKNVTCAKLRSVDSEGYADWEQGQLDSGRAIGMTDYVTHWMPLPEAPNE